MGQLGQTTRKVDKLRYLYETYMRCILQDIISQIIIFLHSLRAVCISEYAIMLNRLNRNISNVCWLFVTFLLQEIIFLRMYKDLFPFLLKVLDGNLDRNSEVKHAVYGVLTKYLRFRPQTHQGGVCMRTEVFGVTQKPSEFEMH